MRPRFTLLCSVLLAGLFVASGCDTSFEAFEDTDLAYSVFGYLDANDDTQWVRIEPVQDSSFAGSEEVNARVTSENVETGETAVWEDHVFTVSGVPVHNFTTTADLEPEATYRFTVERERDGATTTAEVTLPPAFPEPAVINPPENPSEDPKEVTKLLVRGIERLGAVRVDYDYLACVEANCFRQQSVVHHLADTTRWDDGTIEIEIAWKDDVPVEVGASLAALYSFHVTVASVSEDWPEYAEENPPGGDPEGQPLPPPSIESNIENGTGFLGGVFTRTVDVPTKWDEPPE